MRSLPLNLSYKLSTAIALLSNEELFFSPVLSHAEQGPSTVLKSIELFLFSKKYLWEKYSHGLQRILSGLTRGGSCLE